MSRGNALTVGEIARRLECPVHRIQYLVAARGIEPVERAGNLRIFSVETLNALRAELKHRKQASAVGVG